MCHSVGVLHVTCSGPAFPGELVWWRGKIFFIFQIIFSLKHVTRGTKVQQQQHVGEVEIRKETPTFRDTPRGRRCKDFTDDAGYLRSEWARLRLAMLRDTQERHKYTTQQQTMDFTTRSGTTTSAAQPSAPSEYTARRGEMHIQARIGLKLMRIIEGDRDRRTEVEDHG